MSNKNNEKIYFPGLNGLRFIAASVVIIFHLEHKKSLFSLTNYFNIPFIHIIGDLGVTLFFVLSGFLITFLLLKEKDKTGTIVSKKFYIRRILRIWPLYYLIIFLGFLIFPHIDFLNIPGKSQLIDTGNFIQVSLFTFFLANFGFILFGNLPFIDQTWSIGVEEQFYLIWPLIIKFFDKTLFFLITVIFTILILKIILFNLNYYLLFRILDHLRFGCMSIGGIFAFSLFHKKNIFLKIVFNKYIQFISIFILLIMLYKGYTFKYIHHELYSIFFAIIIINISSNKNTIVSLQNSVIDYLGKISYGIYMYHNIFVVISIKILIVNNFSSESIQFHIYSYLITFSLTIIFSAISYEVYEKYFIQKKSKFMVIKSTNNFSKL